MKILFVFTATIFFVSSYAGSMNSQKLKVISYNNEVVRVSQGKDLGEIPKDALSKEDLSQLHMLIGKEKDFFLPPNSIKWRNQKNSLISK